MAHISSSVEAGSSVCDDFISTAEEMFANEAPSPTISKYLLFVLSFDCPWHVFVSELNTNQRQSTFLCVCWRGCICTHSAASARREKRGKAGWPEIFYNLGILTNILSAFYLFICSNYFIISICIPASFSRDYIILWWRIRASHVTW